MPKITHGLCSVKWKHPMYFLWTSMKARCHSPNNTSYKHYGARGITVCAAWRKSFKAFLDDMGERPAGTTLDRVNNSKGYCKANCRWATKAEQSSNTRRSRYLTIKGEKKTLTEWGRVHGIPTPYIYNRLSTGWSELDAVTRPIARKRIFKTLQAKRKIIEKVGV